MILVDSSVWVDYFNGKITDETDYLDSLLGTEPVAVGDPVVRQMVELDVTVINHLDEQLRGLEQDLAFESQGARRGGLSLVSAHLGTATGR